MVDDLEVCCPECGKLLNSEAEMLEHYSKEHGGIEFTCKDCGKTFTSQRQLRLHMEEHAKERKYEVDKYKEQLQKLATLYADGKIGEKAYSVTVKMIEKRLEEQGEPAAKYVESPTHLWFFVPLFFGLIGGLIGYVVLADEDREMAKNLILFGIVMTFFYIVLFWGVITKYLF